MIRDDDMVSDLSEAYSLVDHVREILEEERKFPSQDLVDLIRNALTYIGRARVLAEQEDEDEAVLDHLDQSFTDDQDGDEHA